MLRDHLYHYSTGNKKDVEVSVLSFDEKEIGLNIGCCNLVVNCTTFGMKYGEQENLSPLKMSLIPSNALIYDLVYNPAETPLIKAARQAGAGVLGGLPMLVYQGAAAFEMWTGEKAPVEVMLAAAEKALE